MQVVDTDPAARKGWTSIKLQFGAFLLPLVLIGATLMAIFLPSRVDSDLDRRFEVELIPQLETSMQGLGREVERRLKASQERERRQVSAAFDREKAAIVASAISALVPLVENLDLEAVASQAKSWLESGSDLVGLRIRTQQDGPWSSYGDMGKTDTKAYSQDAKTDYAYVAVEMRFSKRSMSANLAARKQFYEQLIARIAEKTRNTIEQAHGETVALKQTLSHGLRWQILVVAVVAAAAIMTIVMLLLDRIVIRPIRSAAGLIEQIAAGDLTADVAAKGGDELGQLLSGMRTMSGKLRAHLGEVSTSSLALGRAADQLSEITEASRQGVQRQQTETDQVATAIQQMSVSAREVARNAAEASHAAEQAGHESRQGQAVVTRSIQSMEALAGEVESAAGTVAQLDADADSVGAVLDVIHGIAEQTNLLALNAAIEAARAGEQGRGFAVVADEVRTLAGRTQKSTQEIQQVIERLQGGAKNAVSAMKVGTETAKASVDIAAKADAALRDIISAVETINDMSNQIAAAAEEQGTVTEEVSGNVVNITQIAELNAEAASKTAGAGHDLSVQIEHLQRLVGQFRV